MNKNKHQLLLTHQAGQKDLLILVKLLPGCQWTHAITEPVAARGTAPWSTHWHRCHLSRNPGSGPEQQRQKQQKSKGLENEFVGAGIVL